MPRVEYFYLANNMLESIDVVDLQPFNYFTSLKYLDLSNLFGVKVSAKGRAKIVKTLFSNNHSFIDLQDVLLPSNGLEYLEPDTFCSVCFSYSW
jgi:hypothetical protein